MGLSNFLELAGGSVDSQDAALRAAVASGARGEAALVEALEGAQGGLFTAIVAALGDAEGPLGATALRSIVVDGAAGSDPRCAAMVALAKREGAAASNLFTICLTDRDAAVRRYALRCLAYVGDDRAWTDVHSLLQHQLAGPPPRFPEAMNVQTLSVQSEIVAAIAYLARHLSSADQELAVAELVRSRWVALHFAEQEWLEEYWPACVPGRSEAAAALRPNADLIVASIRNPLFVHLYRP